MGNYVTIKGFVDKYGIIWDMPYHELCSVCGQPDNCGDCNHGRLSFDEIREIGGIGMLISE